MKKISLTVLSLLLLCTILVFVGCNYSQTTNETVTTSPDTTNFETTTCTKESTKLVETTKSVETTKPTETTTAPHIHIYGAWQTVSPASCTAEGTEERTCSCGDKQIKSTAKLAHVEVIDEGFAPTCTTDGKTDGKHCSVCNTVTATQTTVSAKGHTEVIDNAVAATCTTAGKTEGKHCSVCNTVIKPQETIQPAHTESAWIIDKSATKTENGKRHTECTICATSIKEEILYAGSVGLEYSVNADAKTCTITGIGTCTDTDIYIGEYISGYKVCAIGDSAFASCSSLRSVSIPKTVTSIGKAAFTGCTSLNNIIIPESVASIGSSAFSECTSFTSIVIPNSVTSIGSGLFSSCHFITTVQLSNNITSIPRNLFGDCWSLSNVNIPNGVTSIGYYSFGECHSLYNIVIPNGVTSIDRFAFAGCSLETITIPNSVISIGNGAFSGNLKTITYSGTISEWNAISKDNFWNDTTKNHIIHCTDGDIPEQ